MSPRITVDHLLALDTAGLVEYLKQNRGPNGNFVFANVDGWEDMPKAKEDQLVDILR